MVEGMTSRVPGPAGRIGTIPHGWRARGRRARGRAGSPGSPSGPGPMRSAPAASRSHLLRLPRPDPAPLLEESGPVEDLRVDHPARHHAEREVEHPPADRPPDVAKQLVGPGDAMR